MKIGVGICTYKRPDALTRCVAACETFNRPAFDLHVQEDEPNIGVCGNKNRILRCFRDYEYIIILEDDAEPIHENWVLDHINAHWKTGMHHFCYPSNGVTGTHYKRIDNVIQAQHSSGMFAFFTKQVIETCGGFSEEFKGYGWGHMEYSARIARAGLSIPQVENGKIHGHKVKTGYPMLAHVENLIKDQNIMTIVSKAQRKIDSDRNLKIWEQSEKEGWIKCPL
jgi:glycosyltransferase involved in cell wall biosynthesis